MVATHPRYDQDEFARRGDSLYDREVLPRLLAEDVGRSVVIDIETGASEVDSDELAAMDRLLARVPSAQPWLRRVGSRHARRIGPDRPENGG